MIHKGASPGTVEGIRSFIAIEIPQDLRARLGSLQREFQRTAADVKWLRPEGIHLTLKFLGSIKKEDPEEIASILDPLIAAWESFELTIQRVGCFPTPRNPRVVWVGVDRGKEELAALQRRVETNLVDLGFPLEDRPFQAHLTLGRVRSGKGKWGLLQALERLENEQIGCFRAREVILYRSVLKPSGAEYTKLYCFPMQRETPSSGLS